MSLVLTVCCAHCIFWLHFVVALVNSSRCFFPFTLLDHFIFKMSAVTWEEEKANVCIFAKDWWEEMEVHMHVLPLVSLFLKFCVKCASNMFVEQNRQFWKVIWKAVAAQTQNLWKKNKLTKVKFTWDELGWTCASVTNLQTGSTVEPGAKILSQSPQTPVLKSNTTIQQK